MEKFNEEQGNLFFELETAENLEAVEEGQELSFYSKNEGSFLTIFCCV